PILVIPRVRLRRGHAERRTDDDDEVAWKIDERINLFAAPEPQSGAAREEERHIGANRRTDFSKERDRRAAPQPRERHERGRRIGTASPESGLKGDLLLDLDDDIADLAGLPERCPEYRRRLPHQVAVVERYAWSPALQREGPGLLDARQRVVELDRLEHGAQLVIPVGADSEHAEIEIHLGVRPYGELEAS